MRRITCCRRNGCISIQHLAQNLREMVLVTVHPDHLAPMVLSLVDVVIAVGPSPD